MARVVFSVASLAILIAGCKHDDRVGRACELTVDAGASEAVVNLKSGDCSTGLCLKPLGVPAVYPEAITGATCTAECSSDSDCDGEVRNAADPQDTRCKNGFACAVPFVVGPLCCKHLCVCRDFLGSGSIQVPVACQGPDALATCQSAAGSASKARIVQETDMYISTAPARKLDLVFMIDDSPSMAPKVGKLRQQFPEMLDVFKDPTDGLPSDLRVAIIDSDLGTGGAYQSGACGPNDRNGQSNFGDLGNFQMRGAAGCGVNVDALWLETLRGKPVNFGRTLDISQVFGCLATNVGTEGCETEHQLQALEFGLVAQNLHQGLQGTFLRPNAYLGLVILSDEDDCSAASNDGMFGDKPELRGESPSLRCATRAHQCGGTNLTDGSPGYPTTASFEANFADCAARTDACPNATDGSSTTDTSVATTCSPLKDVHKLAQEIKALKEFPADQILVAGIFGWPRAGQNGRPDLANAKYKIDRVPNPDASDTAHSQIWDYWPVCYDPDHEPKVPDGTFDADAWAWGARGGLRISAFIDEFGGSGLKYSICERDFVRAMAPFGNSLASKPGYFCLDAKPMDVDLEAPGLQPDCRVVYRIPHVDPNGGLVTYVEPTYSMPQCPPAATPETVTSDCWEFIIDFLKCPSGPLVTIIRTAAEIADGRLEEGTMTKVQCWTCSDNASIPGCES